MIPHNDNDLKRRPKGLFGVDKVVIDYAEKPPTLEKVLRLVHKLVIRKKR